MNYRFKQFKEDIHKAGEYVFWLESQAIIPEPVRHEELFQEVKNWCKENLRQPWYYIKRRRYRVKKMRYNIHIRVFDHEAAMAFKLTWM